MGNLVWSPNPAITQSKRRNQTASGVVLHSAYLTNRHVCVAPPPYSILKEQIPAFTKSEI